MYSYCFHKKISFTKYLFVLPLLPAGSGVGVVEEAGSDGLGDVRPLLVRALEAQVPGGPVLVERVPGARDVGVVQVGVEEGVDVVHVGAVLVRGPDGGEEGHGLGPLVGAAPPQPPDAAGQHRARAPRQQRVPPEEALAELHAAHPARGTQGKGHGVEGEPRNLGLSVLYLGYGSGERKVELLLKSSSELTLTTHLMSTYAKAAE